MIWVRKEFMFAHHIFFFTLSYSSIKPLITPSMSANPMHSLNPLLPSSYIQFINLSNVASQVLRGQ